MNRQQRRAAAKQGAPISGDARGRVAALYTEALARQQTGRLAEAERLYREILAIAPDHPESHHSLGLLACQVGRSDLAAPLIAKAIALNGDNAIFHGNYGNVLKDQGRLDDAVASYRRALALKPDFADAHSNLGNVLKEQGRLDEAVASYRRAIALKPTFADAHSNLGNALREQGGLEEAVASYRCAIALKPAFVQAHYNLGVALEGQGRLTEAIASYEQALRLDPSSADARNNLGAIFLQEGRLEEARACFEQVLATKPNYAEAHNNLGNVLRGQGKFDAAIASYEKALCLDPDYPEAHNNLGASFEDQGKLDEAAASFRRAIALKPGFAQAYYNLGAALKGQGWLTEAMAAYEQALSLDPSSAPASNNLGDIFLEQGDVDAAMVHFKRALAIDPDLPDAHSNLLMCQHYVGRISAAELLASARRFGAHWEREGAGRRFANDASPGRRLRVGYVSGDLCVHPVGFLLANVLETHDRAAFETFCYANQTKTDAMTRRLQAAADHWRMIVRVPDADVAAMIEKDEIDILIDLSGHTAKNRLPVFALRAAPVQASWLGYFGTTGLAAMDYLVMDKATVPYGEERWCSEAVVRLPHGRFCYAPPDYAPPPTAPPAAQRGAVTFGSFNNVAKIGPEVVSLWADVLRAVPRSRLVLKWKAFGDERVRERLIAAFRAAGVEGERLELRGFSRHADMLAEYGDIDIALDPFPFCGGLTSCETLWMGVPIVTWPGDRPASRQSVGFLELLGLERCVARSREDYLRIAAGLAADVEGLAHLRRELRPRMAASPLCEGALFTPTLEAALREMWRRWCASEEAVGFSQIAAPPLPMTQAASEEPRASGNGR